jgi:1,5-anhydro-D-fructose reductase (1,5-anhydro-D-mannitol-forming)
VAALGWGVIGIGRIVKTRVAPAIVAEPECELVAGVSRDEQRAEEFARAFGARFATTDYAEMLAHPDVDVVFIATPNALHPDEVIAAAEAGKHVLCDKPLATTTADAIRAFEACRRAGVKLGINIHYRHMPWARQIRELITTGAIGDVISCRIQASGNVRPPASWRADPALAGLGTVHNIGVHLFDLLRFVQDAEPTEVAAMFDDEHVDTTVESEAHTLLRFGNGAAAYVNCNQTHPYPQNDIAIYGTRGRIVGVNLTRGEAGELRATTEDGETVTPVQALDAHRRTVAA